MINNRYCDGLTLLLNYVDDTYKKLNIDYVNKQIINKNTWKNAIKIAAENGLLYCFVKEVKKEGGKYPKNIINNILDQEVKNIMCLKKSIEYIDSLFKNSDIEYLYIKLYRGFSYSPRDIDVLIKSQQIDDVLKLLKNNSLHVEQHSNVETSFIKKGMLKVDLYKGFEYMSYNFISDNLLWSNPRNVNIEDMKCRIPNLEADLLILLIHALLGHRYISLLDFLYLKNILDNNIDYEVILHEIKKFGWKTTYDLSISLYKQLITEIYHNQKNVFFPHFFKTNFLVNSIVNLSYNNIEKKKLVYFLITSLFDKIYKRYILMSYGRSYYIPERSKNFLLKKIQFTRRYLGDNTGI